VFVVQTIGDPAPVPNPERNGSDWYPDEGGCRKYINEHFHNLGVAG
jgi:hypothetical protein